MQCPNCQREVPDTAKVCGYCGTRLQSAAPTFETLQVTAEEPALGEITTESSARSNAKTTPWWVWTLPVAAVGLLMVICCCLLLAYFYYQS